MSASRRVLRSAPWVVIVVVAAVALGIGAQRPPAPRTLEQRTLALASEVRCPVCVGETAAESGTAASVAIRSEIRHGLAAGEKPAAILAGIEAAYGPGILEQPRTSGVDLLIWVIPAVVALAALAGLVVAFVWWDRRRRGAPAVSDDDRLLVAGLLGSPEGPGDAR
jgi:cytochrome c-type biogenesis protein CcmH